MIKAIIFDCFGVLTTEGLEIFYTKYFKDSPDKLAKAKDIIGQLNLGLISHEEYINQVASLAEVGHDVVKDYIDDNKANEPLLEYIRTKLKSKYKIGMLSNAGGNWLNELFTPEDVTLFDAIVLSYDIGISKPDPRAYQIAADKLQVRLDESVFIDDLVHYCEAAQSLGMKAIRYENYSQTLQQLEKLLMPGPDN